MKIYFLGLSSFLIENSAGYRILVDPFDDSPKWILGPMFPKEFEGKPFGTNLLLISETDADHATTPHGWQQNAPVVEVNSNPFPGLNLRGTVIHEYNGEPCIAWHYTVDGIRLAHFSDNAHTLNEEQLQELGRPDIIFYPIPKVEWKQQEAFESVRKNIAALQPKIVIWAHHIVPMNLPSLEDVSALRSFFVQYFKDNVATNQGYINQESFLNLCYMLESGVQLTREYNGKFLDNYMFEIDQQKLQSLQSPVALLFTKMLGKSKTD